MLPPWQYAVWMPAMVRCASVSVCGCMVGVALGFPMSVEMVHQWLNPLDVTEPTLPWYARTQHPLAG